MPNTSEPAAATSAPRNLGGARVYVAGHRGMVGSAVCRALEARGVRDVVTRARAELDLRDGRDTRRFFAEARPDVVFMCAARVGGIVANDTYPAEFIRENLAIQTNVIHEAWRHGVGRLVFLGSSCIYPRDCAQPIRESALLTGPLERTNRAYAVAKLAGVEMCYAYNRQYATRYLALMPCNLYGPGDHYDLETSHVLPALLRKCHEARAAGRRTVTAWGTGKPLREFLHCDDLADAALHVAALAPERIFGTLPADEPPLVNVGAGRDIPVAGLAALAAATVGFDGTIEWDRSRPDGTPRKVLDVSRMTALGWTPRIGLREGLADAYRDFRARHADAPVRAGQGAA